MSVESVRGAMGRKVVDRSDAEELGTLGHLVVDIEAKALQAIVVGKGRKAVVVDWADISFGPDAIMVTGPTAAREPNTERERSAAGGAHDLVGRRTLSRLGNHLGAVDDVTFDPATGDLVDIMVGDRRLPAASLLGLGSFACVVADDVDPGDPRARQ